VLLWFRKNSSVILNNRNNAAKKIVVNPKHPSKRGVLGYDIGIIGDLYSTLG